MEHPYFPVELDQLAARISYEDLCEGTYEIDGLRVRAQQMNHPSPTLGYRIESGGRSLCYLCDHEPFFEGVWRDGAARGKMESILEAGDRRHAEYMQGADVVIHEAQYTPEEYPSKRHWGHSTYEYVVELAAAAGVRRLFLTHHDPSHDDKFIAAIGTKGAGAGAEPGFRARSRVRLRRLRDHPLARTLPHGRGSAISARLLSRTREQAASKVRRAVRTARGGDRDGGVAERAFLGALDRRAPEPSSS